MAYYPLLRWKKRFREVKSRAHCHAVNEWLSCDQSWILTPSPFALYTPLTCWFDPEERKTSCLDALKAVSDSECLVSGTLKWLIIRPKWGKLIKCTCPVLFEDLSNQNLQGCDPEIFNFHYLPLVFWMTLGVAESLDQMLGKVSHRDESLRHGLFFMPETGGAQYLFLLSKWMYE